MNGFAYVSEHSCLGSVSKTKMSTVELTVLNFDDILRECETFFSYSVGRT
jgi:hypothetical protein